MKDFSIEKKDIWLWKLFIVQPDFVTQASFDAAVEEVKKKKTIVLEKVKFEILNEGNAAQILHVGPFANEGPIIQKLHEFIVTNGHSFDGLKQKHHEIYLSDIRRTPPEKLRTIIRQSFV